MDHVGLHARVAIPVQERERGGAQERRGMSVGVAMRMRSPFTSRPMVIRSNAEWRSGPNGTRTEVSGVGKAAYDRMSL